MSIDIRKTIKYFVLVVFIDDIDNYRYKNEENIHIKL